MNAMQPPQSIEEIKAGLETTEKGGVRQSIRNCLTVFQRDPLLSGAIAYNILTDRKDIIKPIGFHRESTALNDTDMKYLLLYLEETYGLTNEKKIDNAIGIVANSPAPGTSSPPRAKPFSPPAGKRLSAASRRRSRPTPTRTRRSWQGSCRRSPRARPLTR